MNASRNCSAIGEPCQGSFYRQSLNLSQLYGCLRVSFDMRTITTKTKKKSSLVDEKALVKKILTGDTDAFGAIVDQYQNLVGHIVFRMVAHKNDREELCQEVFLKVYKNLSSFKFSAKLSTWIGRIAYNSSINYLKKKKVPLVDDLWREGKTHFENDGDAISRYAESAYSDDILPDEETERRELQQKLAGEIDALPPLYKTLVTLFHVDELGLKEICEMTALPEGTVKSYLFRARKLLKQRLLEKYSGEEIWV